MAPLGQYARVALALLLAVSLAIPVGLTFAPQDAVAAENYTVEFYSDEMAFKTGLPPIYTYENEPEGTVITNPGLATPTTPDSNAHFLGWYPYDPASSSLLPDGQPYDFSQPLMDNLTLVGRYRSDILVTFLDGYGKTFLTRQAAPGALVTIPTDAEMQTFTAPSGYHFEMWMNDGTPYTGGALISDATITPRLSTGSVFVFFVSAGTQVPFKTVDKGNTASEPDPSPTREGYTFQYWSETADGLKFDFNTPITDDTTLYAVWDANTVNYTVLFWQEKQNISGDPGINSANYQLLSQTTRQALAGTDTSTINANAFVTTPNTPRYFTYKTGDYTFSDDAIAGNDSTVLNIYFKRIEYTFTFTLARDDATMTIDGTPYTDVNPVSKYQFQAKVDQDISELWPTNIGTITTKDPKYHFNGWLPTGSGIAAVSKVFTLTSDLLPASGTAQTVTGRWLTAGKDITLHYLFESLDGNVSGAVLYNGKFYLEDTAYTQTLFTGSTAPFNLKLIDGLTGLTKGALAKQGNGYVSLPSTASVDQYLFYDRTVHQLRFEADGGALYLNGGMDYTKIKFGASIAPFEPSPPIKNLNDGLTYTFDGWYLDTEYHTPFDFSTAKMGNADIILFAKWLVSEYTVTIYDDLTTTKPLTTLQRAQGAYVGDPTTYVDYTVGTTYEGKGTFEGWVVFIGPGATALLSFDMPVTGDIAVHASWKAQTYSITYTDEGAQSGTPPEDDTLYTSGVSARVMGKGALEVPTTPVGTQFIGWKVSGAGASAPIYYPGTLITITDDITLDPVFETATPTFTLIRYSPNYLPAMSEFAPPSAVNQFSTPSTTVTTPGFEIFGQDVPGSGFHFLGWSTTPMQVEAVGNDVEYHDGDGLYVNDTGLPIYLYALWSTSKYHIVHFDSGTWGTFPSSARTDYAVEEGYPLNGGTGSPNQVIPPEPAYDDDQYTFIGWSPAYSDTSMIYEDQTYVAQYEIVPPPPDPSMPPIEITNIEPTPGEVYLAPYSAVYDGEPHHVTVLNGTPGNELPSFMTFHHEEGDPITSWVFGNPTFKDIGDHVVTLAFTAQGHLFASASSYVEITPCPITVTATHADIPLDSDVPKPNEYAISIGNIVGDESFNANQLTLSTTYKKNDPVGTYQILADPGIFGNYELPDPGTAGVNGKVVVGSFNVFDDGSDGVLEITKAPKAGQPLVVKKGDEVTYAITIANSGTGNLDNVRIAESMTGVWSNAVEFDLAGALQTANNSLFFDIMPAGSTYTVDFTVIAGEGTITNTVIGTSSGGDDTVTNTDITGTILEISKAPATEQPLVVEMGDLVTYTVTIHNLSESTVLNSVLVTESMTGGTWSNAVGFTLPGADGDGKLVADSFVIPAVAAGATWTVNYTVAAVEGTNINTVTADGPGGNGGTDTNTDITGGILEISKTPAAGQDLVVDAGTPVTYTITIRNLGIQAGDDLSNVLVTENMAGGTWSNAVGFTLPGADGDGKLAANSFTITSLPANTAYTVNYTVAAVEGTNSNTVTINGPGGNGDTDTNTDITGGVLKVSKAPAAGQPLTVKKGDEVTYTITIHNFGIQAGDDLSNVLVTESMTGGTWSNAVGFTLPGGAATLTADSFTIPTVTANSTYTVNYTVAATGGINSNTVTINGPGGNGDTDTNTNITGSVLEVSKALAQGQSATVKKDDPVAYTISVKNNGTVPLNDVVIVESMPGTWSNASTGDDVSGAGITLDVPSIAAGATFAVDYTVIADGGTLINTVAAYGNGGGNTDLDVNTEVTAGILSVEKAPAAGQPAKVRSDDEVTYTITLKNVGAMPVLNVTVTEDMPGGTWSNASGFTLPDADPVTGTLKADSFDLWWVDGGAVWTVDYTIVAGATGGAITNSVTATDGGPDGDPSTDDSPNKDTGTDTGITIDNSVGVLEISKAPAAGQALNVEHGDEVTYTVTIQNSGTAEITDVLVVESLPGVWLPSGLPNALDINDAALVNIAGENLTIASLPAGATYTVNYRIVAEAGTVVNTVTATSGGGGGGGGDTDTDTSVHAGSLEITKEPALGQPAFVKMGDDVTYTIAIKNLGTQATDALTDVRIVEDIEGTWSDAAAFDLDAALQNDNSLLIDTILPGRTLTVNYTVTANEGTVTNTVTGTSGGGGGGDTDTNTDITGGVLDISKAPATGQAPLVEKGDLVTYTITIKNLGVSTILLDVLVSEAAGMPGGTWSNAKSFTLPGADVNGELVADDFIIPTVTPGTTLTVDYTVEAGEGTLVNTVTATNNGGDGPDTDTGTNTDIHAGILDIQKAPAGQATLVETGTPVTYTITIKNLGEIPITDDLSDVLVTEGMPGGTWSNAKSFTLPGADVNGELVADSFTIPTVAVGTTLTVDYTVAAVGGLNSNTVTAKDDGGTGDNGDTDTDTSITAYVLTILKELPSWQPSVVKMGDPVTYTISVINSGAVPLTNVFITEYLTGTWSNPSSAITLPSSGTSLTIPSIAAGATFTVDYTVVADTNILVNTVSAFDDEFNFGVYTNDILSAGDLEVSKRPADGQPLEVKKGDPVVYTIEIHNSFMGTALYDVLVTEGMGGGTWSSAVGFALPGADANGRLTADSFIIPTVDAGATLTVDYTVAATEGVVSNTVTVADDGGDGDYTGTDTNVDITGTPDSGGGGNEGGGGEGGGGTSGGGGESSGTLPASGDTQSLVLIISALALLVLGAVCVALFWRSARHRQAEKTLRRGFGRDVK